MLTGARACVVYKYAVQLLYIQLLTDCPRAPFNSVAMICPDIWKLPAPNTHIQHRVEPLSERTLHQLERTINSHYFNSLVIMSIKKN